MNELDIIRNHFLGFHNDFFDNFRTVSTYPPYNVREKNTVRGPCQSYRAEEQGTIYRLNGKRDCRPKDHTIPSKQGQHR